MVKTKAESFGERIQEIYEDFMKCISSDQSKGNTLSKDCFDHVLLELKSINVEKNSKLGGKIRTLEELISKRLNNVNKEVIIEGDNNYPNILSKLGVGFVEYPKKKFADVKGMDEVKRILRTRLIYPINFKDMSKEFGIKLNGGILLYGPPGNGKTLLAEALAGEAGIKFLEVNPAYLYNEYFGKFEKNISEIFKIARKVAPNILFFDEVETLIPKREGSDQGVTKRGVTQFLIEINKLMLEESNGIYVVAATNLPWEIDIAMLRPGRFDLKIYIPPPSEKDRVDIINSLLKKNFCESSIDPRKIASLTKDFSAADLNYLFRRTAENVFYEAVQTGVKRSIDETDILAVIPKIKASLSKELIKRYESF